MKLHRLHIHNFRNFRDLDIKLGEQVVVVGENKIGKSNLLYAMRLVLDPALPDSARQLHKTDFWDGLGEHLTEEDRIEISIEFAGFEDDPDLLAQLGDGLIQSEPMISRLTYVFQARHDLGRDPLTDADYEFTVYKGEQEDRPVEYQIRRRVPLDVLPALRDVERDLASWNQSPLRPLLSQAISRIDSNELTGIAKQIMQTTSRVLDILEVPNAQAAASPGEAKETQVGAEPVQPIRLLETRISSRLTGMVGKRQNLSTVLGFTPTDPDRLIRTIRLFIDGGRRGVQDASLGSANLLYLALTSLERDLLAEQGERDHTLLGIEEPEAHLHPHLQRLIYRSFLRRRPHLEAEEEVLLAAPEHQTVLLTTHSPHVASVAPLKSIVLLRRSPDGSCTVGVSAAELDLSPEEVADLERYLDVTRGELLFSQGVLLVEGIAEEYLVPALAQRKKYNFDELGITVCTIAGTNFLPYVRLLLGLKIPFAVLTDADPQADGNYLGHTRALNLLSEMPGYEAISELPDAEKVMRAAQYGIFLNTHTLEVDLFEAGNHQCVCDALCELTENKAAQARAKSWADKPSKLDRDQYLKDIKEVSKGRLAQRLASKFLPEHCPDYIAQAIDYVVNQCQ